MSQNKDMDQATNESMQTASDAGRKLAHNPATNAAKSQVRKGAQKMGRKAGKALMKAGAAALKLLVKAIIWIISVTWPILLVIAGLILLVVVVDHFMVENRGASQEYDFRTEAQNEYADIVNEYGDPELMVLSEENAFLQIFYEEESKNSYWKYYEKGGEVHMDFGGNRDLFDKDVKDKYGREQYFLMTAMNLYALEEYLNENYVFSPQTFIQHVPFEVNEDGRLDSVPLVDEDGEISIKSQAYEEHDVNDEGMVTYRKKYDENDEPVYTEGVWDYGLAPVYHYKMFTEEYEVRSWITGAQIWDIEKQEFRQMTTQELSEFENEKKPQVYKDYQSEYDLAEDASKNDESADNIELVEETKTQDVWMIQDAVTPMGAIKNEIEQVWQQSNRKHSNVQTITMNVPVRHTRMVQQRDERGRPLWTNTRWEGRYVRDYVPLNHTGAGGVSIDFGNGNSGVRNPNPSSGRPSSSTQNPRPSTQPPVALGGDRPIYEDPGAPITRFEWGEVPNYGGFNDFPSNPNITQETPNGNEIVEDAMISANYAPPGWKIQWRRVSTGGTTTENTGENNKIMVEEEYYLLEPREHQVETTGFEWEYIPRYVGEPDTSDLDGLNYYHQYFENYENFVTEENFPSSALDDLDIELPTAPEGEDEDEWFKDLDVSTPMDMLKLAKMDEERNQKRVDDMGRTIGKYDKPLTVEERLEGASQFGRREHPVMKAVRDLQVQAIKDARGSGSALNLEGIDFAEDVNSDAIQNASEYYDLFVKYGELYGVDPMLLLAIAAHESNGRHYANPGELESYGVRRSYDYDHRGYADLSAIGLMQVRPLHGGNASVARDTTAFNHDTQSYETFYATAEELHDPDINVKFATMLLANEIANANGDVFVGVASYHYGRAFEEHVRKNNLGTWSMEAEESYLGTGAAGSLGFVPNVMQYYLPTEDSPYPWAINADGQINSHEGDNVGFAADGSVDLDIVNSVTNRRRTVNTYSYPLEDFWEDLGRLPMATLASVGTFIVDSAKAVGELFGVVDGRDHTDYYHVKGNLSGSQAEELIYMMMSYEEGLYMHEYEQMTEEEFEERFLELFLADVANTQDGSGLRVNPNDYFPDGYQSPVDNVDITVGYTEEHGDSSFHGIQLAVPGGAEVYAVADGVISTLNSNELVIDHGNHVSTVYKYVGEMNLRAGGYSVGDEIKKGTLIGRGAKDGGIGNFTEDGSFAFALKNPMPTDPTWIVDPSVMAAGGSLGVDPDAGDFQNPYYGKTFTYTSNYSHSRFSPTYQTYMPHVGVDMAGTGAYLKNGTGLGAVADGVVTEAGFQGTSNSGWGYYVVIRHDHIEVEGGGKMWSLYAHLMEPTPLSIGDQVQAGQVVGREGTTGGSTGEHLHLEFIVGHGPSATAVRAQNQTANTVDPRNYLDPNYNAVH